VAVLGILALGAAGTAVYTLYVRPMLLLVCDMNNMATITRNWDWAAFPKDMKGRRFCPDELKVSDGLPAQAWQCPFCGERYAYRPVNLAGIRIACGPSEHCHFVMWCPRAHPGGKRVFMLSDFSIREYAESEVSWYYQKKAEYLSPEEREQENRYRAEQRLPLME